MKKIILTSAFSFSALALEFGSLGNIPLSMGYAGVALKDNDFAAYYNPASLIYSKNGVNFSFGANYNQKNLLELSNLDKSINKKIETNISKIKHIFNPNNNSRANNLKFGNFGSVIDDFISRNTNSDNEDLALLAKTFKDELDDNLTKDELDNIINDLKNKMQDNDELSTTIKTELITSTNNTNEELNNNGVDTKLLTNIISDTDTKNVLDVIKNSKDGNVNLDDLLLDIGDTKLDTFLDENTLNDIELIYNAVYDNEVNLNILSGLEYNNNLGDLSAFSVSLFNTISLNTYASLNKEKSSLIIKIKDDDKYIYLKLFKNNSQLFVTNVSEEEYLNHSAMQDSVKNPLNTTMLMITEVPISYANGFIMPYGELSLGASLKYMNIQAYQVEKGIKIDINGVNSKDINIKNDLHNAKSTNTFGIDIGALYSIDDFSTGLVIKNLNNPKIKFHSSSMRLNPQVRFGLAYKYSDFTFAFDADLVKNTTLSNKYNKSQMLGGGVKYEFNDYFNLRGGLAYNIKKDYGTILTTGANFFNIFDIALASGLKSSNCDKDICKVSSKVPNYFDLRIGFGYKW